MQRQRECFIPPSEYLDQPVTLAERGHHISFMFDVVRLVQNTDTPIELIPQNFSKLLFNAQYFEFRYSTIMVKQLEDVRQSFEKLREFPWFKKLFQELISNSFWSQAQLHDWDEDLKVSYKSIYVHFRYLLAYLSHTLSPIYFERLVGILEEGDFNEKSLEALQEWQTDTSFIDGFIAKNQDVQNVSFSQLALFVDFCLSISKNGYGELLLPVFELGNENFIRLLTQSLQEKHRAEHAYFREIKADAESEADTEDTLRRLHQFAEKVIASITVPQAWILLHTLPSNEICNIYGDEKNTECARHCLRLTNQKGDQEVLDLIELFVDIYPQFQDQIHINYDGQFGKQAIFQGSLLLEENFRKIFFEN